MIERSIQSNQNDAASKFRHHGGKNAINLLRKVQSLDGLRLNISAKRKVSTTADQESIYSQSPNYSTENMMASNFSKFARRKRLSQIHLASISSNFAPDPETSEYLGASCTDLPALETNYQDSVSFSSTPPPVEQSLLEKLINSMLVAMPGSGVQNGSRIRVRTVLNFLLFTLLFFATLADVAFWSSDQLSSLSVPLYYDALSPEVISPPFHYRSTIESKKSRSSLGSAMIGSITDALSPILPFAGGVDLRRNENWGEWLPTWMQNLVQNAYTNSVSPLDSVTSVPRGGSTSNAKSNRRNINVPNGSPVFSTSTPFVPINVISEMSLGDIALVFQYTMESSNESFDRDAFISHGDDGNALSALVINVIDAIDSASSLGRGDNVLPSLTQVTQTPDQEMDDTPQESSLRSGDVDALKFCAAMRILAEWRVLRQVPDGYKGYAVGMSLGHKDVVQNLGKMEAVIQDYINSQKTLNEDGNKSIRSPTLRQLLQHEVDLDVHPNSKLPRLKEKSAGMGLLWVRRQLQYQTAIFANVLEVPSKYTDTKSAVGAAYTEVYGQFHGWAVQKIFNYSFQAAPQANVIYRHMNPRQLLKVLASAKSTKTQKDNLESPSQILVADAETDQPEDRITDEYDVDTNTVYASVLVENEDVVMNHVDNESYSDSETSSDSIISTQNDNNLFMKLGSHIVSEWEKVSSHVQGEFEKVVGECDKLGKHVGDEWEKFGRRVIGEWDKVSFNVVKVFDPNHKRKENNLISRDSFDIRGGGITNDNDSVGMTEEQLDEFVTAEMEMDAHRNIRVFLTSAKPLLKDLEELFIEMNMDDPTKV